MKGKIIQFRRGRHTIHERHFLIDISAKDRKEAENFAGKEIIWASSGGKKIPGRISAPHGNKGLVRAIFEKGLPGQAINDDVEITGNIKNKGEIKSEKTKSGGKEK